MQCNWIKSQRMLFTLHILRYSNKTFSYCLMSNNSKLRYRKCSTIAQFSFSWMTRTASQTIKSIKLLKPKWTSKGYSNTTHIVALHYLSFHLHRDSNFYNLKRYYSSANKTNHKVARTQWNNIRNVWHFTFKVRILNWQSQKLQDTFILCAAGNMFRHFIPIILW